MTARFFIPFLSLFLFISCKKENRLDCFKGNGEEITEIRNPGEFSELEVNDKVSITIVNGADYQLEVTAGEHIISNISTSLKNGILKIENRNTCNFVRGYKKEVKIKISLPYLKKLTNNGVGTVTFENFIQDTLRIRAGNSGDTYVNGQFNEVQTSSHGNGDIYLNGSTNSLMIYAYGTNFALAENMLVNNYVFISNYSFGDAKLKLKETASLDYLIWNDGNIYYQGNPTLIRNLSEVQANGGLIKVN